MMNEAMNITLKDAFIKAGLRLERWDDFTETIPERIESVLRTIANALEQRRMSSDERRARARQLRRVVQQLQVFTAYSFVLTTPAPVETVTNGHDLTTGMVTVVAEPLT